MAEELGLISSEERANRAFDMQEWRETIDRVMDALQTKAQTRKAAARGKQLLSYCPPGAVT
jgi:hypothetical protein